MKHLDEGSLQALADGELPPGERRAAEAHLAGCAACAAAMASLRADHALLGAALARADVAPPTAQAQMSLRRRRATAGRWAGEARRALLRAAVLVLALGGVAFAAVPGSPLRSWLDDAVAPDAPAPAAEVKAAPAPAAPRPASGVSILPDDGAVKVELTDAAPGLLVRVRLTDEAQVGVSTRGDAVEARFRTSPGKIRVLDAGPGEVLIALPSQATAAVVEVDGRVYVAKDGDRLRVTRPGEPSATAREAEFRVRD